jgi:C-terminal processing protease CtpA/Prc
MRLRCRNTIVPVAAVAITAICSSCPAQTATPGQTLTTSDQAQVIDALSKEMKAHYVFPETAAKAIESLRAHQSANEYDAIKSGDEFAARLTHDLQAVCKDAHLRVQFSAETLPVRKENSKPSADEIKQFRQFEQQANGGLESVQRLNGNVGYIELRGFFEPQAAARPMRAAMEFLAGTDALIIDLRRNGGGDPNSVRLFCSYLFGPGPVHLNDIYFREGNKTVQFWTLQNLPGPRYLNREVYVLTSKRTASGAEECSYDLQMLKRATIIGEVTWGGANPGDVSRLTDHFSAFIPGGTAINPYSHKNWEGAGIQPDIPVAADQALQSAHVMAIKHLLEKATSQPEKDRLTHVLKDVAASREALNRPEIYNARER